MPPRPPTYRGPGKGGRSSGAGRTTKPAAGATQPHVEMAEQYARDVVAGTVVACQWVRLACKRHLNDLERSAGDWSYRFDAAKAEKVCKFIELLPHTKGKWAKKDPANPRAHLIALQPWQCFILCCVFGWVRKADGLRRFRVAYICVPRKNGKSAIAAGLGLYMFAADGEHGAEVYSGATTEKQAWEVFGPARLMANGQPALKAHFGIEVNASNIHILGNSSKFEPVIGKPGDGASPSCALVDEYHEHATSDLYDTMITGMGAREQPLAAIITTAGDNLAGPCYDQQLTVQKVLEGVLEDDELFGIVYTVDKDDDWTSEDALRKANPNFGVSVGAEFLLSRQREAIQNSRRQGVFKTKHLNVWVNSRSAYFNMQRWAECYRPGLRIEDFEGRRCFVGIDLASKVDIAAVQLWFPPDDLEDPNGIWTTFGRYYLPEETVEKPENEHYRSWMADNRLVPTDGAIIDFGRIEEDLVEDSSRFQIENVGYDPSQATMLVTRLMNAGLPCTEYRQIVMNMSDPMKTFDALIQARRIEHDQGPKDPMTWMMSNVVARTDNKDNVYPVKERAENKIDGPVAAIIGLGVANAVVADEEPLTAESIFGGIA